MNTVRKNEECSEIEFDNWALSEWIVKKLVPIVGTHPFPLDELLLVVRAIALSKPKIVFEWGTHIGKSARLFHEIREFLGADYVIHSCDLPDDVEHVEHPGEGRGAMVKGIGGVVLHQGDGVETSVRLWHEAGCPERVLFFCDGDHSYESVKREVEMVMGTISSASMIFHDTLFQSEGSGYNTGPARAVAEFLLGRESEYVILRADLGLPGMLALIRREQVFSRK